MSTPFTIHDCGLGLDLQVAIDSFANLRNQTLTFECYNGFQTGPFICPCDHGDPLAFCIGAHNQQHACVVGKCSVIDWAKQHASPCSSTIMQFTNAQSPGLATPCCDNQFCTTPAPQSFICTPTAELWLCVVDGAATECVKPRDNTICSGNFTNPVAIVSTTSSYVFSMPTGTSTADGGTDTSFPLSSTGASRGLSSQDIIIIVVVVVVGSIALLAGGLIYKKVLPACRRRRRLSSATRANNVTVSGGALTEVRGDHNTYHIYPAEISTPNSNPTD